MFVVFVGPPGAGKGTQCQRLLAYLGVFHLSTGDLLRRAVGTGTAMGLSAQTYMRKGELVPDPIVLGLVGEQLESPDCDNGCLFDGFPRNVNQARAMDEYLEHRGKPINSVIELAVEHDELVRRLTSRKREDDNITTIVNRLKVYEDTAPPLLEYYEQRRVLDRISGIGEPDEIFAKIRDAVDLRRD